MSDADRRRLFTMEAAAATVRAAEADEYIRQMLAGIETPVVDPLPYYVLLHHGELHSVHATHQKAALAATTPDPSVWEIRPMKPRPATYQQARGGGGS
ncbi:MULTISPECIES: hypothetical protein [unclassified Streptomyces]|uniref:hypothetical protein n=1 Tax=unclassified Streptomyces TaxID=2593676 RepID=UPI000CD58927|nr:MULTISPECIES: hypothetical protein [unclassified Streptomyces]AWL39827.1 hypothetical protein B9S64_18370 [Streptomyces sp. SM18]